MAYSKQAIEKIRNQLDAMQQECQDKADNSENDEIIEKWQNRADYIQEAVDALDNIE